MQGHRHGEKMEEVAVKQGPLYLLQQQTFGKVRARLGRDWAEGLGGLLEIPGMRGSPQMFQTPYGKVGTVHPRPLPPTLDS